MSLVIGILCSDGIVIGAESAATVGGLMRDTIRQTARKIHVIEGRALIGASGLAGLAQRYVGELKHMLSEEDRDYTVLPPHRLMVVLQQKFLEATQETMQSLVLARKFSELGRLNVGLAGTIVAMKSDGKLAMFSFDEVCNPESATPDMPFISVGSGQILADPFLAHLKHVLWGDAQPTLALGVLGVVWTLQHAISVISSGLGEPIHVYQVTLDASSDLHIEEMDEDSVFAALDRIGDIERAMRNLATRPVESESPPPLPVTARSVPKRKSVARRKS